MKVVGTADIIAGAGPINLLLGPHRGARLASAGVFGASTEYPGEEGAAKGKRAESGRLPPRLGSLCLHVQRSASAGVLGGEGGGDCEK